jgi:hypothetical protein
MMMLCGDRLQEEGNSYEFEPVSELQALERTMSTGHICPTGPDTMPTIPHPREDPMVLMMVTPDLYFAGNGTRGEHGTNLKPFGFKFATSLVATGRRCQ